MKVRLVLLPLGAIEQYLGYVLRPDDTYEYEECWSGSKIIEVEINETQNKDWS
jgi:hypothetical protein